MPVRMSHGPDGHLGYVFRLAHQELQARLARALAAHDLSLPQYSALSAFAVWPAMTSAELGRALDVTAQSSNAVVHQLLGRGLVEQRPGPTRGKARALQLSEEGRSVLEAATTDADAVEEAALAGCAPAARELIMTWLSGLARAGS